MRISSIISEYNPFHEGHKYHMEKTKKITNADYCIVIMSGDFTQRGAPAIMDKYARTKQALCCGADLVLELPVCFSTSSAEGFAFGAVSILEQLNVVDTLVFGSECGTIEFLQKTADFLTKEPPEYKEKLQTFLKQGLSFPKARANALKIFFPDFDETLFSSPNNILGIEYCRALKHFNSSITPMTIMRKDNSYHDRKLSEQGKLSSATAIREMLLQQEKDSNFLLLSQVFTTVSDKPAALSDHMPKESLKILQEHWGNSAPISSKDFSLLLKYKLLLENHISLTGYLDVNQELSDRIYNNLNYYQDFDSFCNLLKTKELTYTRIARSLLHVLLDLKKEDFTITQSRRNPKNQTLTSTDSGLNKVKHCGHYARILGFKKEASPLLHEIKKNSSIPLISKLSDSAKELDGVALTMLEKDIQAAHIYESVVANKFEQKFKNEFQRQLVIL